jgi:predicted metal-dependent phosphoesterase TrpH
MCPAAVVERAACRGVRALALTDHDEVSGLEQAREAAARCGMRLINGVEISVSWSGHTVHIVGLMIDPANATLVEGLRKNRSGRHARAERIAAELESVGISGALEGARGYATNPDLVSRAHFARFLVACGKARSTQAVFDRYLAAGKPGYVPHAWASLQEAVDWIRAAGGLPVLAHPGRYKVDTAGQTRLVGEFKERGGAAVEVVTGSHTPDQFQYWGRIARAHGLAASCGSDFHGPQESYRDLGDLPPLPFGCDPIWRQF